MIINIWTDKLRKLQTNVGWCVEEEIGKDGYQIAAKKRDRRILDQNQTCQKWERCSTPQIERQRKGKESMSIIRNITIIAKELNIAVMRVNELKRLTKHNALQPLGMEASRIGRSVR